MFRKGLSLFPVFGACYGALVWLGYALVEYILCTLIPLRFGGFTLPVSHWRWTALVFGSYAAAGFLLGGLAGATVRFLNMRRAPRLEAREDESLPIAAALTFVGTYFIWLLASGAWHGSGLAPAVISLVLAITLSLSLKSGPKSRWQAILACPGIAPVLLLCPYKILTYWKGHSEPVSWVVSLGWAVVVCLAMLLLSRVRTLAFLTEPTRFAPKAALLFGISIAIFALSAVFDRGLPPASASRAAHAAGGRPNVLLVIWDTVRADRESLYGYPRDTTPFLRDFSGQATLYKNAFAASDMTLSASASLFTGLYASWHGAHFSPAAPYGRPLDGKFQTIAEVLKDQGYSTMAVLANCSYLSTAYKLDQGFQLYDVRTPVGTDAIDHKYYLRPLLYRVLSPMLAVGEFDRRFRRADEITDDVLTLLGPAGKQESAPFFLAANYMDAHMPYIPPPPYDTLFPGKDPELSYAGLELLRKEVLQLQRSPSRRELAHITSQYDGAIAFMDSQLRRLVTGLRQRGLYDSTLIILTADHGEALGERQMIEHAVSVYQDQVHIPLIVKYPRQSQGAVVTAPVSGVDIMPTVLDVTGIAPPTQVQGRTLRQPEESRFIVSESFRSGLLAGWHSRFDRVERAIVKGPFKLIQSTKGKNELYDLASDPEEARNLYRADDGTVTELSRSLAALLAAAPPDSARPRQVDQQTLNRLRSLGYIQ